MMLPFASTKAPKLLVLRGLPPKAKQASTPRLLQLFLVVQIYWLTLKPLLPCLFTGKLMNK
jgi:hypothetical protein